MQKSSCDFSSSFLVYWCQNTLHPITSYGERGKSEEEDALHVILVFNGAYLPIFKKKKKKFIREKVILNVKCEMWNDV